MVLNVLSLTIHQYDGADGRRVWKAVQPYLIVGQHVTLSFAGVRGVTSSFVNEALIRLLDTCSYDDVKRLLSITDVTRPTAALIRDRFEFESCHRSVV